MNQSHAEILEAFNFVTHLQLSGIVSQFFFSYTFHVLSRLASLTLSSVIAFANESFHHGIETEFHRREKTSCFTLKESAPNQSTNGY